METKDIFCATPPTSYTLNPRSNVKKRATVSYTLAKRRDETGVQTRLNTRLAIPYHLNTYRL